MRINLTSVFVDDQEKARRFYTETLGFRMKRDIPLGEYRWLTVVSPEEPEGTELLLEPDENPRSDPTSRRWLRTASRAPRSVCRTWPRSTRDSKRWGCGSRSPPPTSAW